MSDDCPDHAGGTCEPHYFASSDQWECQPERVRDFWWPTNDCPDPDHPGASLDCATTKERR